MTSVWRLMKRFGIPCRERSEANRTAWPPERHQRHSEKLRGKPTWSLGKRWTYNGRIIKKPNLSGAKNPRWKGGKTALAHLLRSTPEYRAWRDAIFTRDDYTCQKCGLRAAVGTGRISLNADHIQPFSRLLTQFHITTAAEALACAPLWDVANGQTLCHQCHRQTPTYG